MSIQRGPRIIKSGLVLALDATNDRSWQDGNSYWYDMSGNGNHALVGGSPTTQDAGGLVRNVYFDGSDYFTVTANEQSLNFKNGQTVGILMYTTYTSGRRNPWDQAYGGYGTWTHEQGDNINYYHGTNGGNNPSYTSRNSGDTPQGNWLYMVCSRDAANVTWYKNGVQTSQSSSYGTLTQVTTNNIRIGTGYAGGWIGNMCLVHCYNRGLRSDEVTHNYNAIKNRFT